MPVIAQPVERATSDFERRRCDLRKYKGNMLFHVSAAIVLVAAMIAINVAWDRLPQRDRCCCPPSCLHDADCPQLLLWGGTTIQLREDTFEPKPEYAWFDVGYRLRDGKCVSDAGACLYERRLSEYRPRLADPESVCEALLHPDEPRRRHLCLQTTLTPASHPLSQGELSCFWTFRCQVDLPGCEYPASLDALPTYDDRPPDNTEVLHGLDNLGGYGCEAL